MKIGLMGDIHIGARNDSEFFLRNTLDNLNHYLEEFIREGVDTIIQFGDIFDRRKYINYSTLHKFRVEFLDRCKKEGISVYALIGNHDIYFRNSLEVNSLHCLLGDYRNIKVIHEPVEIELGGVKFLLLPWVANDNKLQCIDAIKHSDAKILCGHLEIKDIVAGVPYEDGFDVHWFERFPMVLSGHYHGSVNNGHIRYIGNVSELTWSDEGGEKACYILDTQSFNLTPIVETHRVFEKIQYQDDIDLTTFMFESYHKKICRVFVPEFDKISRIKFDLFLDLLGKEAYSIEVVEGNTTFFESGVEDKVDERVLNIFELISSHLDNTVQEQRIRDKNEMLQYTKDLYQSAIDLISDEVIE